MAAGAAMPLLTLGIGAIEIAEYNRVQKSMQTAADAAVLSIFSKAYMAVKKNQHFDLSKSIKTANNLFDANFTQRHRVNALKRKLSGRQRKSKLQMTYSASANIKNMFGDINPLAGNKIIIHASAEFDPFSGKPPRLVYTHKGSVAFD